MADEDRQTRDLKDIIADERLARHEINNEILLVAADMQHAIEQVRSARESLMDMIARNKKLSGNAE